MFEDQVVGEKKESFINNERLHWKLSRALNTGNIECYVEGFCLDFIDKGQYEDSKQKC